MENTGNLQWDRIKVILFDIDGTLSDSDDQMIARVEGWLNPLRLFLSEKKQHQFARWLVMAAESPGNFLYNQADRLDIDGLLVKLLNRRTRRKKHKVKKYWIIPGIEEMLQVMEKHFTMGVVSARDEISSKAFIRQFNLEKYFKVIVTSQTCHHTKPFPEPLLFAAKELNVSPQACLIVGDTTVDMRAAKLAGMQALGVLCGFGTRRELLRAGADLLIDSTAQLPELLERYQKKK